MLDSITFAESVRRRGGYRALGAVAHSPADSLAAAVRSDLALFSDSDIARGLTIVMRHSSGFGGAQAIVAADLYVALHLPVEPARALVADERLDYESRAAGLYVIGRYGYYPGAEDDIRGVLCRLVARAKGIEVASGNRNTTSLAAYLNVDEFGFFSDAMALLASWHESGLLGTPVRLRDTCSSGSHVCELLRERARALW